MEFLRDPNFMLFCAGFSTGGLFTAYIYWQMYRDLRDSNTYLDTAEKRLSALEEHMPKLIKALENSDKILVEFIEEESEKEA